MSLVWTDFCCKLNSSGLGPECLAAGTSVWSCGLSLRQALLIWVSQSLYLVAADIIPHITTKSSQKWRGSLQSVTSQPAIIIIIIRDGNLQNLFSCETLQLKADSLPCGRFLLHFLFLHSDKKILDIRVKLWPRGGAGQGGGGGTVGLIKHLTSN